jgi:hypothetical protein
VGAGRRHGGCRSGVCDSALLRPLTKPVRLKQRRNVTGTAQATADLSAQDWVNRLIAERERNGEPALSSNDVCDLAAAAGVRPRPAVDKAFRDWKLKQAADVRTEPAGRTSPAGGSIGGDVYNRRLPPSSYRDDVPAPSSGNLAFASSSSAYSFRSTLANLLGGISGGPSRLGSLAPQGLWTFRGHEFLTPQQPIEREKSGSYG